MRENQINFTTFLMLSMLIIVSSIRESIGNKQRNSNLLLKNTINDEKNIINNRERQFSSNHQIIESNQLQTKEEKQNKYSPTQDPENNKIDNYNLSISNPKKESEFSVNKTESDLHFLTTDNPSTPSSFPFIVSLNFLDTSNKNTADQNKIKIEDKSSDDTINPKDDDPIKDNSSDTKIALKTSSSDDSQSLQGNKADPETNTILRIQTDNIHAPYPVPETTEMRYTSLFSYVVFGTSFLFVRLLLSLFKTSKNDYSKYFLKGMKIITNQNLLYFVMLSLLIIIYTFGLLDSIQINWEYFIASLAIFGVSWVLFCMIVLLFCTLISKKWDELETNTRNSFDFLKNNIDYKGDNRAIYELYEYLILKYFFCIPQYQVFKESNLRKEINFAFYLKYCLLQNFRLFSKLSWTCWIILIFVIYLWSVYVSNQSVFTIVLIMMLIPLLGILISIGIYFYMRGVYRKIVDEVDSIRVTTKWTDIEAFKPTIYKNLPLPNYLTKIDEEQSNSFSLHEHFHGRLPSFYEQQVIFGATGYFLLINIIQSIGFIFIAWCILLFIKHFSAIFNSYGYVSLAFLIPIFLFYLVTLTYVICISLRWYTLISSVKLLIKLLGRDEKK